MRPRLGAHMSVAGGLPRAVERAVLHGCEALQIFSKNASRWHGRPLGADEIRAFRAGVAAAGLSPVVSHASYLINLAAADPALRHRSMEAMADEIDRAESLGLLGVVLHPGASTTGTAADGIGRAAEALRALLDGRPSGTALILVEQTAGQGTALGASFEQIAALIDGAGRHARLGVCLDTCHLLAAGYDLTTAAGYAATFDAFEQLIGFPRLRLVHLNDSKRPLGSRVDRHTHIGDGFLGTEAFRRLVNDPRFGGIGMLIETPKGPSAGKVPVSLDPFDQKNLALLRSLLAAG